MILFDIDNWIEHTSEMDSDCRGWYLNLLSINSIKGSLPNNIELLANIAGVKFSEFERFKQVYDDFFRREFTLLDDGRLSSCKSNVIFPNKSKKHKQTKLNDSLNKIDDRKLKFADTLKPFLPKYGKDLLNDFYKYWTEPNKSNTKFRMELEETWSLERRLETWAKNDKNFGNKENQPKQPKYKEWN